MTVFCPRRAGCAATGNEVNPGAFDGLAVTVDEGHPCPVVQPDCGRTPVAP
jgi:hypothetical protein